MNNDLFADWRGTLRVRIGQVAAARKLWRQRPLSVEGHVNLEVPAGDVAILDVRLK